MKLPSRRLRLESWAIASGKDPGRDAYNSWRSKITAIESGRGEVQRRTCDAAIAQLQLGYSLAVARHARSLLAAPQLRRARVPRHPVCRIGVLRSKLEQHLAVPTGACVRTLHEGQAHHQRSP